MTPGKWARIIAIAYTILGWPVLAVADYKGFNGSFKLSVIMIVFNIFVVWYENRYRINARNHKPIRRITEGVWLILIPILMAVAVILAHRYNLNPFWN